MASVDSYNNLFGAVCLAPATYTGTELSEPVDMLGYESVTFFLVTGNVTDGAWSSALEDSNVIGSGYGDVVSPYLVGTEPSFSDADDNQIYRVGYVGGKRYVRLNLLLNGQGTTVCGIFAVMGAPRVAPVPVQPFV